MDTEYDFLTPEFLHLIFFKQKNIVIFPHVDLKHLRTLEIFTVGYNLIDLEATALYNIREMIRSDAESYSHTPNYHLIYNLNKKKAKQLLDLENAHAILNITQNATDLIESTHSNFVFYNKKSTKFLNYDFENVDLTMERMILSLAKNYSMLRDALQEIKNTANKIYIAMNSNPESLNIEEIASAYTLQEQERVIEFTENYYNIILPEDTNDGDSIKGSRLQSKAEDTTALDFTNEFDIIQSQNKHLFQVFITQLDEYRTSNVNPSNLELSELFTPSRLYNYLRRHHWSEGFPKDFLIQWKDTLNKNGELSEKERADFQTILHKLGVQSNFIDKIINNESKYKQKSQESLKNRDINSVLSEKQKDLSNHNSIPPISDFIKFKSWMIQQLNFIEERLKSHD
ncbi:MAG: hypothetical protein ACQERB_12250 [Promethearchaeati archaeon]